MNLRDLTYVIAVADLGHFGRAAEACKVSQPTLSGQILKLEEELGVRIFERDGRKVRPSVVGEDIIARARAIAAAADEIVALAEASQDPLEGPIRFGLIPTVAPYLLPHVLPSLAQALPKARLAVAEDLTVNLLDGLAMGRLDAIVIATDPKREKLVERLLFDEDFWLATSTGHPLVGRASVSAADIDPNSLLLLADGHCLRDQTLEFCGETANAGSRADLSAASLETLLHLTAADQGVTLVPRLAIGPAGARGDLVARPLEGPGHSRRVRLVYRANSPRATAIEALCQALRRGLPEDVVALA
jgi:LysR family transcriptional regulator, hydrogen peroxide-inducible genes activator